MEKEMHDCAVRMLKETHGIDLVEEGYHTKLISDIPDVDIIIYMGCKRRVCVYAMPD